jgi:hypothetical protein
MKGKCKLYGEVTDLKRSHIVPKFAFDYMKKTGSRYLRGFESPNVRVQDGPKKYLLGERAEQEFSKRERWFTNNVFYPYLNDDQQRFEYDENFAYFIISMLWRVILVELESPSVTDKRLDFLSEVAEEWRGFLVNSKYPGNYNDLNILLTDRLTRHTTEAQNADLYMSRYIDATIIINEDYSSVGVYVKFLRFMFWSVLRGSPTVGKNIKVQFTPNKLILPQAVTDNFFGNFIFNRIKEIDNGPAVSAVQERLIFEEIQKNETNFWDTDAGRSMKNDHELSKKTVANKG